MDMLSNVAAPQWADASLAAVLFAIDPVGTGGISVHAHAGSVRDQWLANVRALLPQATPIRRMPVNIADERLLGGLDLGATLSAGKIVAMRGLLADADGGVVVVAMAERLSGATAARIAAVIDRGEVAVERDGIALRQPTRFGVIVLDEGLSDDETPPAALLDRLAFQLNFAGVRYDEATTSEMAVAEIATARARLQNIVVGDDIIEALCAAAVALGVASIRGTVLAVNVARAHAALEGRDAALPEDATVAARLVLGPRATQLPQDDNQSPEEQPDQPEPPPEPPEDNADDKEPEADTEEIDVPDQPLEDVVLEAATAAIPADLLAQLRLGQARRGQAKTSGKAGAARASKNRGRPIGAAKGEPRAGVRLNVIETLRAAAPWQRIRAQTRPPGRTNAIEVRRDDFRITRFKNRTETTTIFVVDASGSSALNRLAEAKGAVELLLADCYVRRDRVALVSFRGKAAEILLAPTRSLARAKRQLASLPGGGGTPLAAAIDAAFLLAQSITRKDETPVIVFLTDGRANVARDGTSGRAKAQEDAFNSARQIRAAAMTTLLVDTSPQSSPIGPQLAVELGARYLSLPYADARLLSKAIQAAVPVAS